MEILYYLGISHAIFGFALLLTKRPKHISNIILGIWIMMLAVLLVGRLLPFPVVKYFRPGLFPIHLCFGPFLFFYIRSLTKERFQLSYKDLLHFLPFIFVVLHRSFSIPVNFGPDGGFDFRNPGQLTNFIYYTITTISITAYAIIGFIQINKHKENLNNIYSYQSSRYTLTWLWIIVVMFLLIFTFRFVANYFNILFSDRSYFLSFDQFSFVFFIIASSFFGVNQPVILSDASDERSHIPIEKPEEDYVKYNKSTLSNSDLEAIKDKIILHLETEQPFLNPEYNINNLAKKINVPRHHVTQAIYTCLEKNFYTLINEYRVKEVISRMGNKSYDNLKILALAFDSGFNSKSAFNRIFKESTGKTPSHFRESLVK